jgi:hypothetical protein
MSDQNTPTGEEPETPALETPTTPAVENEWEDEEGYDTIVDRSRLVRFLPTSGGPRDVAITEPMSLYAVLTTGSLTFAVGTQFEMDGVKIGMDTIVQPGATIVAIGQVKGG